MKKNVMMRIASILLVCVLVTTCGISGTFAKYVTTAESTDSARVAKWGVKASVTGKAFATTYNIQTDVGGKFTLAAESSTTDRLVAPGTTGTFTGVALTGTPEVAVNITKTATITLKGWELSDGTFYCPITITINGTEYCGLDYPDAAAFAAALKGAIEAGNGYYKPLTVLSTITGMNGDYTWAWAFAGSTEDGTGHANQLNKYDTYLGNQEATKANTNTIAIAVAVVVEQVD